MPKPISKKIEKKVVAWFKKERGNITIKELGRKLGISYSKVSQILTFAIANKKLK